MIVRRKGGLTEFIPSPKEMREGLIHDHVLELVENLHRRIKRLERVAGFSGEEAEALALLMERIQTAETRILKLHTSLIIGDAVNTK